MRDQRRRRRSSGGTQPLLVVVVALLSCLVLVATYFLWRSEASTETATFSTTNRPTSTEPPEPPAPERSQALKELRSEISRISKAHAGTQGVVVFDPYSGEKASLNAGRPFVAASLSKLYALLTLYKAAARGEVDLDEEITMRSSDIWAEGTGILYRYPPGHTMTLRECAQFLIKESDNTAEVMLKRYLGEENIEAELDGIGAHSTSYWEPNTTTPDDILMVLKKIADPSYTSPELSAEMLDIMTDTSFEGRLAGPLAKEARVAHKIGSYESTFSDAGIVFPDERGDGASQEYYIVVFSEGALEREAKTAIQDVSLATYQALSN
ncbi:MAG TPA: serine hydrolase [Rubrobacter sp.]|nr:serine hydrolase [Rubrobacter sp.]